MMALAISCILAFLFPAVVLAQAPNWEGPFRVSANGGGQFIGGTLAQTFTVQKNLEAAPVTVDIDGARALWFDAGVAARVRRQFGASVSVAYAMHHDSAGVSADIPHPFFFNRPRGIAGTVESARRETAVHIDAVYFVARGRLDVLLSGGPTIFHTTRDMVTDVGYTDAYPFDTATFASASTTRATRTEAGYNVSADATWKLSTHVGVGALARYAHATATFTASRGIAATSDLGGLQVGGGLRLAF